MIYLKCAFVSLLLLLIISTIAKPQTPRLPALKGRVTTITGLPIDGASITIESIGYLYTTKTDAGGYYKTELPIGFKPDIYQISIGEYVGEFMYDDQYISKGCKSYFRPTKRANIRIDEKDPSTLNFILIESGEVCSLTEISEKTYSGIFPTVQGLALARPRVRYEEITNTENIDLSLNMIIQYGFRSEGKGQITFSNYIPETQGTVLGKPFPGVIITYNNMTIYANKVESNKSKTQLQAFGNIIVENGKEQFRVKSLLINLDKTQPIFKFVRY